MGNSRALLSLSESQACCDGQEEKEKGEEERRKGGGEGGCVSGKGMEQAVLSVVIDRMPSCAL